MASRPVFKLRRFLRLLDENLEMVQYDTVRYLRRYFDTVVFDAEHFFDGYRDDPEYALSVLSVANAGVGLRCVIPMVEVYLM